MPNFLTAPSGESVLLTRSVAPMSSWPPAGLIGTRTGSGACRLSIHYLFTASTSYTVRFRIWSSITATVTVFARPSVGTTTDQVTMATLNLVAGQEQTAILNLTTPGTGTW